MKKFIQVCGYVTAGAVAVSVALALIIGGNYLAQKLFPGPGVKVYDCSIAEISPDYPTAVKEGCRNINRGKYGN